MHAAVAKRTKSQVEKNPQIKKKTRHTAATGRKKGKRRNKKHKESRICLSFYLIRLRPPSRLTIPSKEEPTSWKPYSPLPTGTPANGCKIQTQVATAISQAHTKTNLNLNRSFSPSLATYVPLSQKISESSFVSLVLPGFRIRVEASKV